MQSLHIVHGGIDNGDKKWLEKAARQGLRTNRWIVPSSVTIGDEVVVYVSGFGFFATAAIWTSSRPRDGWERRYSAGIESIRLIQPAISLGVIKRIIPALTWANYPRAITTPPPDVGDQIRKLIQQRRRQGVADLDEAALDSANLEELREAALLRAMPRAPTRVRITRERVRSRAIHKYVLMRAEGRCEGCGTDAPFFKPDSSPYLEPHHLDRLADDGPDHPDRVLALCPNCHREAHHSIDVDEFKLKLLRRLVKIARRRN